MADATKNDVARSRAYLETGCQLGSPMMCEYLGHRLERDADPGNVEVCYPPDEAQARAALAIACSAGWTSACE